MQFTKTSFDSINDFSTKGGGMQFNDILYDTKRDNERLRKKLLKECLELGLPVSERDDVEILSLIYEAAMEKANQREKN